MASFPRALGSASRWSLVALSTALGCAAFGCSDDGVGTTGGGAANSGGAGSGASATGGASGGCAPACVAPQLCSAAGQCIDEGTCLEDGDCKQAATICDPATHVCVPGGGCAETQAKVEPIPPNLLLALDRSCSMKQAADPMATKWEAAVAAITTLTTTYDGKIRFGLSLFPDLVTPNCAQDALAFSPAPGNEPGIQLLLTNALVASDPNYPSGPCVTNIDTAMQQAAATPELADTTRDSYVALITDGKQAGCNLAGGDAGTLQIITDLYAAGVPTFVVGFGNGVDPAQMDTFAIAGGVPNTMPFYYDAADQASLEAVLDTIATKAISCTFSLDKVPPNVDDINVFFDGAPVSEDPTMMAGWTYDATNNQIVFHGADCTALKSGTVTDVKVILGCPPPM